MGLSLWNVGETPEDENASAMMEYPRYSRRKRIDEPGSPVRKGGVVHLDYVIGASRARRDRSQIFSDFRLMGWLISSSQALGG